MDEWENEWMEGGMNELMKEGRDEENGWEEGKGWKNKRMNGWMNEYRRGRMNEWMNERMKDAFDRLTNDSTSRVCVCVNG